VAAPQEIRANQGTEDQLPQGAAAALNEAMPSELEPEGLLPPDQVAPTPGEDGADDSFPDGTETFGQPEFMPRGMDEEILFLDSERGMVAGPTQLPAGRLPDSVVRMLDVMGAAAAEPGAPESLRAIYAAAVNALDASLR
jgi:hypothetical protein